MTSSTSAGCGRAQSKLPSALDHRQNGHRQDPGSRKTHRSALVWLLASTMAVCGAAEASAAHAKKSEKKGGAEHHKSEAHGKKGDKKEAKKAAEADHHRHVIVPPEDAAQPLTPELVALKEANEMIRHGKGKDATALAASTGDPVVMKLTEWALLRHSNSEGGFERYASFVRANPEWPSISLLRRRAEARLWQEHRDAATIRNFVGDQPASAAGRLALARVEMAEGNRAHAEAEIRTVWQSEPLSGELETAVLAAFPDVLTHADHVARMDRRIGAKDFGAAARAAKHAGEDHVAIIKACSSAEAKSSKGGSQLDGVHGEARDDLGFALCRLHWLLRNDSPGSNMKGRIVTPKGDYAAAVKLVLSASPEDLKRQDTDEWWRERRSLARKLLDIGDARNAYEVARTAAPPVNPYYRAETHFLAGWIALRFLNDPTTAATHFAHIDDGAIDPLTISRAMYWRGRAAEAAGQTDEMREQYEAAAGYPTTYYGQLARARLGLDEVVEVRTPPEPADSHSEVLRAAEMLYRTGEGNLALSFATDLAQESKDPAVISGVGRLTARYHDAQAMMQLGKAALGRGMPMDHYAFPDIGVPNYTPVASALDRCIVYAIVRTESGFDQGDKSAAKAVGLMQVTPDAARDTAKRFGVSYDWNKLVSDPVYNTQMGAGELSGLLKDYHGSYILTFAGYNAGRGRVEQWMAAHGDPRDPKVDAVDWVERIPFSETRNYVQRVMENLQVYRKRFNDAMATTEPNLHRTATLGLRARPASVELTPPR